MSSPTAPVTSFKDASLLIEQGDKHKDVDVDLRYESDALVIQPKDKKEAAAGRTFKYADVASAEYSLGKSPRVLGDPARPGNPLRLPLQGLPYEIAG